MPPTDHLRLETCLHRAFGCVMSCKAQAELCRYPGIADDLAQVATELAVLGEALISARQASLRRPRRDDPQERLDNFPEVFKARGRI